MRQLKQLKYCGILMMIVGLMFFVGNVNAKAAYTKLTLSSDRTMTNAELSIYDEIDLNKHTLTINGDFTPNGKVIGENGSELIVKGNITASNEMDPGKLHVTGNYTQKSGALGLSYGSRLYVDGNATFTGAGTLGLYSSNGILEVKGDLLYNSSADCQGHGYAGFCDGVIRVGGNIIQGKDSGKLCFPTLNMTGKDKKLYLYENASIGYFNPCEGKLTVYKDIEFLRLNRNADIYPESGTLILRKQVGYTSDIDMQKYEMTIHGNLHIARGGLDVNGPLTIEGNLTTDGDEASICVEDGGKLKVKGDCLHTSGWFSIGSGALIEIDGNMKVDKGGVLYLKSSTGSLYIGGNLTYNSTANSSYDAMSKINIGGNFEQAKDAGYLKLGQVTFAKEGASAKFTNGKIAQLIVKHDKNRVNLSPADCCIEILVDCDITFDANGGNTDVELSILGQSLNSLTYSYYAARGVPSSYSLL